VGGPQSRVALELKDTRDWETLSIIYGWVLPFRMHTLKPLGAPLTAAQRKGIAEIARESFRMAKELGVTKAMLAGADEDPLLAGGANGGAKPA
jgi:hypothetical protein